MTPHLPPISTTPTQTAALFVQIGNPLTSVLEEIAYQRPDLLLLRDVSSFLQNGGQQRPAWLMGAPTLVWLQHPTTPPAYGRQVFEHLLPLWNTTPPPPATPATPATALPSSHGPALAKIPETEMAMDMDARYDDPVPEKLSRFDTLEEALRARATSTPARPEDPSNPRGGPM